MTELQALLDEREIMRGLARFARVLDGKQWDDLASVFDEDVSFDYGTGKTEHGIVALTANMRRFLDVCGPSQHLIGSVMVDVTGDEAVSRSYVQARHQRAGDQGGAVFDTCGEYVDRWERKVEGWRIVHRLAIWATHSGDAAIIWGGA